jgi:putative DNA primase/helicase
LQDATGNRRWWPVQVYHGDLSDLDDAYIDQIWAEALHLYKAGEPTYLSAELEAQARMYQAEHTEIDERQTIIERYLEIPIPDEYYTWSIYQRRAYLNGEDEIAVKHHGKLRDKVSILEIWTEALGLHERDLNKYATRPINDIMKNLPGWEKVSSMRIQGQIQRGYRRVKTANYSFLN